MAKLQAGDFFLTEIPHPFGLFKLVYNMNFPLSVLLGNSIFGFPDVFLVIWEMNHHFSIKNLFLAPGRDIAI
jgi:hypothetical protein